MARCKIQCRCASNLISPTQEVAGECFLVFHAVGSPHSFNWVAEQMLSVKQANEIVAKLRELLTEQNCVKDFFDRSMRASQTGGDGKLNFREAERRVPGMFNVKATASIEHVIQDT